MAFFGPFPFFVVLYYFLIFIILSPCLGQIPGLRGQLAVDYNLALRLILFASFCILHFRGKSSFHRIVMDNTYHWVTIYKDHKYIIWKYLIPKDIFNGLQNLIIAYFEMRIGVEAE